MIIITVKSFNLSSIVSFPAKKKHTLLARMMEYLILTVLVQIIPVLTNWLPGNTVTVTQTVTLVLTNLKNIAQV